MSDSEQQQYLTFLIGEEEYGVPVLRVREIVAYGSVTRVPSAPSWIRGVINLRGVIVPVVDLALKFGLPATRIGRRTCIVIVEVALVNEETAMGVLSDAVQEVATLAPEDIEPPPPFGSAVRIEFLIGMRTSGRGFLQLLDIDKVLATDELLAVTGLEVPKDTAVAIAGDASASLPALVASGEGEGQASESRPAEERPQRRRSARRMSPRGDC